MKSKLYSIALIFTVILLTNCTKNDSNQIELIYPTDGRNFPIDSILFSWSPGYQTDYLFELHDSPFFDNPLIDTSIIGTSFMLEELMPNTGYYWSVSDNERKVKSSFKTINHLDEIASGYQTEIDYSWQNGPNFGDTTFVDNIRFNLLNQGINVEYESIDYDLLYLSRNDTMLFYSYSDYHESGFMRLNYKKKYFTLRISEGSLGSNRIYDAYIEY